MKVIGRSFLALAALLALASSSLAVTKYPGLNFVLPLSVRQGETSVVLVDTNGDVTTAYKALVEGAGITARVLPRDKKLREGQAKVELTVAKDAAVGPREIRLATKEAITTLGQFYVTRQPIATEATSNDTREKAQEITLPVAINGQVEKAVDEDWFKFRAAKGDRVTFSVRAVRLHDTIHKIGRFITHFDPMLTLTDENGVELASNDDHYYADPLLSFTIPADGDYCLALREATYKGNPFYTYTLVGTREPWPMHVVPMALSPGQSSKVQVFGPGYDDASWAEVTMPEDAIEGSEQVVQPKSPDGLEEEVTVIACDLPLVREEEENDSLGSAQKLAVPSGVAGAVGKIDDVDYYQFDAKKGAVYEMEVVSRRLFTPLDSQLEIHDVKGKRLALNDDFTNYRGEMTKDSSLQWKAPQDGVFSVSVRDVMGRGGPEFAYHLRLKAGEPDFDVTCDPELAMIGPGARAPIYVRIYRRNGFDAPVRCKIEGLPKGVSASELVIPSEMNDGCIVLTAAKDAPIDAQNIAVTATADVVIDGKRQSTTRHAVPLAEIYQAQRRPVRTVAVAVTEPSDITVETSISSLELRPGESKEIPITITRAKKYETGPVTLWADWRFGNRAFGQALPPGVTVDQRKSQLTLNGSSTKGKITLVAAADAKPIDKVPVAMLAQVSVEFSVNVPYCTAPIAISVLPKK